MLDLEKWPLIEEIFLDKKQENKDKVMGFQ